MRLSPTWRSLSLVLSLTALACAGPAATSPAPGTPATSSPAASSSAPASTQTVELSGLAFQPATLQVKTGTHVQYVNKDAIGHTVTNGQNGVPDAQAAFDQPVAPGAMVSVTFDKPGTVHVTCKVHPTMNQTVEVAP
jgi:plastocyanin